MPCPVCSRPAPEPLLTLRGVPAHVAAVFGSPEAARAVARGDIRLALCEGCGHVWNDAYDPALTDYGGHYDASLHHSPAYARFLRETAEALAARWPLAGRPVAEVGCGEGTFLRLLARTAGGRGIGIDPSAPEADEPEDHAPEASGASVAFWREPFGAAHAAALRDRGVALVASRQMLHYVPRPVPFLRQMAEAGAPLYAEVPNGAWVFAEAVPWTVFYEHVHYFAPSSLARAFAEAGLACEAAPVYREGQYLAACSAERPPPLAPDPAHLAAVRAFGGAARRTMTYWRQRLGAWAEAGERVVAWGAAGRGTTFANAMPEGSVAAVADNNPARQGAFLAGTGHPIVAPEALLALAPHRVVLTNPTYAPEILAQLAALGVDAAVEVV